MKNFLTSYQFKLYMVLVASLWFLLISCNNNHKNSVSVADSTKDTIGTLVSSIDQSIWVMLQDMQKNYWFGSNGRGVYKYDGKKLTQYTVDDGLSNNQIRGIQQDKNGIIYFETPSGVCTFDGRQFVTLIPVVTDTNQWLLHPDDLWFKKPGLPVGVYRYDGKVLHALSFAMLSSKSFDNNHDVYSLYKDTKGNIWFGTLIGGVGRFNGHTLQWMYEDELGALKDGRTPAIRSIVEDQDGLFWFSNFSYQYRIKPDALDTPHTLTYDRLQRIDWPKQKTSLKLPYYTSAWVDRDTIWMTSYNEGIWKYHDASLTNYTIRDGDLLVQPMVMLKDHMGIFWIGTDNAGVYRFDGKSFEKFMP